MFSKIAMVTLLTIALFTTFIIAAQDTQPPASSILFHDDFEDDNLNGWDNYNRDAQIIEIDGNRVLHLSGTDWTGISLVQSTSWDDYLVEARLKIITSTDGQTPDLFFNTRSSPRGDYGAWVSAKWGSIGMGGSLNGTYRGIQSTLVGERPVVLPNTWHTMRWYVFGNQLKLSFNNQLAFEAEDAEIPAGGGFNFGIAPNVEVYIDDVYVLNADVPTVLEPDVIRFGFDPISSSCDYSSLSEFSGEALTGIMQKEVNLRAEPNTEGAILTLLGYGEEITITGAFPIGDEVSMNVNGAPIVTTIWLEVQVERNGEIRSGYVWGGAVDINPPTQSLINPYDVCFPQVNTTGWVEALKSEIGDNWSDNIHCNALYYPTCFIALVMDGVWIEEPIPLYNADNELMAIAQLSMRGYYLDMREELHSVILPVYVQTDFNRSYQFDGFGLLPNSFDSYIPPNVVRQTYEREHTDLRGHVACVKIAQDREEFLQQYFSGQELTDAQETSIMLVDTYQESNVRAMAQIITIGHPGIGILLTDSGPFNTCIADVDGSGHVNLPSQ
jgi:hypothetical protein